MELTIDLKDEQYKMLEAQRRELETFFQVPVTLDDVINSKLAHHDDLEKILERMYREKGLID